ncbi:DUF6036 family nucleotidyltransferase [Vitreoscilla stercoraria]|uniref:DUF6036 domain-containing protein n=1 Tax=Vitreoscilla stercoraria TaxID=61 RepID=A0ABY4E9N0_VITST|nr:DUF6036 family nucleotidyltransferase [Vitreoscilla stercoraria]UOO92470.1 hypothetical protein LVJ81_12880 [Vitreoscilla stercoraria]
MIQILDKIHQSDALFVALKNFLSKIDQTLPPNKNVKLFLFGGMLVYLYTGLERSYYIEGEFNQKVYIPDGLNWLYTHHTGQEKQIRFNKNDNSRFNLLHQNYLQDAQIIPFTHLKHMQVYALSPVDVCVSKIARLSLIDIEDIQLLVKTGLCSPQSIEQRAKEASSDYIGDLSQFHTNLNLAIHYARLTK